MVDWQPVDPAAPAKLKAPAIALLVTAILGLLWDGFNILVNAIMIAGVIEPAPMFERFGQGQRLDPAIQGALGVTFYILTLLAHALMILGSIKMLKAQTFALAMTAAILAVIPCVSPCCLVGIPFGIWALIVLANPDVKSAFTS